MWRQAQWLRGKAENFHLQAWMQRERKWTKNGGLFKLTKVSPSDMLTTARSHLLNLPQKHYQLETVFKCHYQLGTVFKCLRRGGAYHSHYHSEQGCTWRGNLWQWRQEGECVVWASSTHNVSSLALAALVPPGPTGLCSGVCVITAFQN